MKKINKLYHINIIFTKASFTLLAFILQIVFPNLDGSI